MGRKLKIAIAEDEDDLRQYFASTLQRLGHEIVVEAANGRELLEGCQVTEPDLIISDIRMDELDGIEAMRELALDRPSPTILISAYDGGDFDGDHKLVAFLQKPIKSSELEAAVKLAAESIF